MQPDSLESLTWSDLATAYAAVKELRPGNISLKDVQESIREEIVRRLMALHSHKEQKNDQSLITFSSLWG